MWTKCVHHVVNKHEWVDTSDLTPGHCLHPPLLVSEERPYLAPDSPAANALRTVVFDTKLLKKFEYYRNFR